MSPSVNEVNGLQNGQRLPTKMPAAEIQKILDSKDLHYPQVYGNTGDSETLLELAWLINLYKTKEVPPFKASTGQAIYRKVCEKLKELHPTAPP